MSETANKASAWSIIRELPSSIWQSVFRNPVPASDHERASTSFTNFFLHIHPVKVHTNTMRPSTRWDWG